MKTLRELLHRLAVNEDPYIMVEEGYTGGRKMGHASELMKDLSYALDDDVKDWYWDDADYYDVYILI